MYDEATIKRFWDKVDIGIESECWIWQGRTKRDSKSGEIPQFCIRNEQHAHRVSWAITFGNLPAHTEIRHSCYNRMCVNPNHLYMGIRKYGELEERFWRHAERGQPKECWIWQGGKSTKGYAVFRDGKESRAHRTSWKIAYGEIPPLTDIKQVCANRMCVNPNHLVLGNTRKTQQPSIEKSCQECKKLFKVIIADIRKGGGKFCSKKCNTDQKIRMAKERGCVKGRYGPSWKRQKKLALIRDGYICQKCGKTREENKRAMDVHHIIPFRMFGYIPYENDNHKAANALNNLVCLCKICHKQIEPPTHPTQLFYLP